MIVLRSTAGSATSVLRDGASRRLRMTDLQRYPIASDRESTAPSGSLRSPPPPLCGGGTLHCSSPAKRGRGTMRRMVEGALPRGARTSTDLAPDTHQIHPEVP